MKNTEQENLNTILNNLDPESDLYNSMARLMMGEERIREIASNTSYIYGELMGKNFFSNFDQAYELAVKFTNLFPSGTNWEKRELDGELNYSETIYDFYFQHRKNVILD